ncbi:MAG: hypothetical protein R8F63_15670 [Acidimicrobiales bacterium]|nr:hypothetical protein [Acidimicrobiales bacterium]
MTLRQLWKLLSGAALLVIGLLVGASSPAAATTGGCAGDYVVALDVAVWSRSGHDTYGFTLSEPLPAGEWSVQASSFDVYPGRSETSQDQEQWLLDITGHVVLGPTSDLADGVDAAAAVDQLGTFVSESGVSHFTVRHAAPSTPKGTNSVTAQCVAFSLVDPPTTTTTTVPSTTVPPTTVPPSTVPPSTVPSTTVPPTTVPPTTVPPTTVPPTTAPPTTAPPTTAPPTTAPPTTAPPPTTIPEKIGVILAASAVVDCAADEVIVLLGNQGDTGATVDVAVPRAGVTSGLTVEAGAITTSTLAIGDLAGTSEIRVSDSITGETLARADLSVDCADPARPTATTILDCTADVLVVRLGNDAGDPASLTVLHERVALVAEVTVAAGEAIEVEIPLAGAATVPVRVVDAAGADVLRTEIENVCPAPEPPDPGDDPPAGEPGDVPLGPRVVRTDCDSVAVTGTDRFEVVVELDGTVVLEGSAVGDTEIPVLPGAPTRVIVSEPKARSPDQVVEPDPSGCADVQVIVEPDCPSDSAAVSIRRTGVGRERFVVLVDGAVAGVLALEGTGTGRVPVALGDTRAELTVSRSMAAAPIVVGSISCTVDDGVAGPIAASLVVLAVIASAAGALPWPLRLASL